MRTTFLALVAMTGIVGCGGGKPKTYAVTTTLKVNGEAPTGANITLHPAGEWKSKHRERPFGKVRTDGTVKFSTFRPDDGVPAGDYVVTIHWPSEEAAETDRLRGEHQSVDRANPLTVTVPNASTELAPIELTSAKIRRR